MKHAISMALLALILGLSSTAMGAMLPYGDKGIYPIYESNGQWLIYDKNPGPEQSALLSPPQHYLVIGSEGAAIFYIARDSMTYGGMCQGNKPLNLNAGLLKGPRSLVGRPIIGIHVPPNFSLKGSRAVFHALNNDVNNDTYKNLSPILSTETVVEIKDALVPVNFSTDVFMASLNSGIKMDIQTAIDFAAQTPISGLTQPSVLVTKSTVSDNTWRCLREAVGTQLIGGCALMPLQLMAETSLLQFVTYDPSGDGHPLLFAYTRRTPWWGDERWGFVLGPQGPDIILMDAMDIRCREGF